MINQCRVKFLIDQNLVLLVYCKALLLAVIVDYQDIMK